MNNVTRRLTLCLVHCALCLGCWAQGVPLWLETSHDFGTIREQDGRVTTAMRVVNAGDSALLLLRVHTSCGCTAVDFTREPIAPGGTGNVTVTYSPKNRPGEFSKDVWVYCNGRPGRSQLTITGNVIPEQRTLDEQYPVSAGSLRLSGAILPVGEVTRPGSRNAYLNAYNASTDTLLVTMLHAPAHIRASALPDTVPPGSTTAVTVFFDSRRAPLWGLNVDSLGVLAEPLHPNAEALSGITRIEVMANVREDFEQLTARDRERAPVAMLDCGERLTFEPVRHGQQARQSFTITNCGRDALMLRRLWSGDSAVTATASQTKLKHGKRATITVTVDTSKCRSNVFNALLNVMTNDPDHPNQILRLVGEVRQQ